MDLGSSSAEGSDKVSAECNILFATHPTFTDTDSVGFIVGQPITESDTASASASPTHTILLADRSGSMSGGRIAKINALLATLVPARDSNIVFATFNTAGR